MSDRLEVALNALIPMESFHRNVSADKVDRATPAGARPPGRRRAALPGRRAGGLIASRGGGRRGLQGSGRATGLATAFDAGPPRWGPPSTTCAASCAAPCDPPRYETSGHVALPGDRGDARAYFAEHPERFVEPERLQVQAITIGVAPSAGAAAWTAARAKADAVRTLRGGCGFEETARRYSTDPSAAKGGDMGAVHRGSLSPQFETVVATLAVGGISPVVETIYGYHVIRVTEVLPARPRGFADVGARLQQDLTVERCASDPGRLACRPSRHRGDQLPRTDAPRPEDAVVLAAVPAGVAAQQLRRGQARRGAADGGGPRHHRQPGEQERLFLAELRPRVPLVAAGPAPAEVDTELTYRTNRLSATGTDLADQHGQQDDLGFRVGAFGLSSGAFPFYVQASRVFGGSTVELDGNPLRASACRRDRRPTSTREPRAGRRRAVQRAGPAARRDCLPPRGVDHHRRRRAGRAERRRPPRPACAETSRTRQALRYQRNGYDNSLTQAFSQHVDDLDYEFSATLANRFHAATRVGTPAPVLRLRDAVDSGGAAPTRPPPACAARPRLRGDHPQLRPPAASRVRLRGAGTARVGARHHRLARGDGRHSGGGSRAVGQRRGHYGDLAANSWPTSACASGRPRPVAGVTYPAARDGSTARWAPRRARGGTPASSATAGRWSWSARPACRRRSGGSTRSGYDRASDDQLLDYGNYDSQRGRASVSVQSSRLTVTGSAERLQTAAARA